MSDEIKKLAGKNFYEALIWLIALLLAIVNYNWLVGNKLLAYLPNFTMLFIAFGLIVYIFYLNSNINKAGHKFVISERNTHFILVDIMNATCKASAFSVVIFMFYHRKGEFLSSDFVLQAEFFELFFLALAYSYVLWFNYSRTR